eukprot:3352293-Rhodomonas_salina.1
MPVSWSLPALLPWVALAPHCQHLPHQQCRCPRWEREARGRAGCCGGQRATSSMSMRSLDTHPAS